MLSVAKVTAILSFIGASSAWTAPSYSGYNLVWQETFAGNSATSPNGNNWNIITGNLGVNGELETYTSSTKNLQLSGGGTLQIVPWRDGSAQSGWTSGRIESKYVFTPAAGKVTRAEASIRFGGNSQSQKQGMWPAFWLLGNVLRNGGSWPSCGEIDIMEVIDGQSTGHGTLHCNNYPGGICNEPNGIGSAVNIPSTDFQVWRVEIDRTASSWQNEKLTWSLNGNSYQTITGSRIGDYNTWNAVAHSPLYFILNLAVGGGWPGNPNGNTLDGYGSMMEVGYVAQYST